MDILESSKVTRQAAPGNNRSSIHAKVTECLASIIKIGVACSVEAPYTRMNITNAYNELNLVKNTILRQ